MNVRIVNLLLSRGRLLLADELSGPALRLEVLQDPGRGLLDLLLRGLVVRRPHDEPVPGRADVLHLHGDVVLLHRLRQGVLDVERAVRAEVRELHVAVDRDGGRDDVLLRDLDEGGDPVPLEPLRGEGVLVHHALLERAVEGAERVQELVPELLPQRVDRLPEALREDRQELLRLLLVLPLLDLLPLLVLVDRLQREVDVALLLVHAEDLADELLSLPHVVADVLDPAAGDLRDVDEPLLPVVLVEGAEGAEVLHVLDRADDELALLGPLVLTPLPRLHSTAPRTSPRITAFPPVGFARVAPHTWHRTTLEGRSKTTCSLPQSAHLTLRNRDAGVGIIPRGPPRVRTSSPATRAAGAPSCTPSTGIAAGSASWASPAPPASASGTPRTRGSPAGSDP